MMKIDLEMTQIYWEVVFDNNEGISNNVAVDRLENRVITVHTTVDSLYSYASSFNNQDASRQWARSIYNVGVQTERVQILFYGDHLILLCPHQSVIFVDKSDGTLIREIWITSLLTNFNLRYGFVGGDYLFGSAYYDGSPNIE